MSYARLYRDGSNSWWALAKCDACQSVHRYPLTDAIRWPVACQTCYRKLDVRQVVREGVTGLADVPPGLCNSFAADSYKHIA